MDATLRRLDIPKADLAVAPVRLKAGTSARAEWRTTYDAWKDFGSRNSLNVEDRQRLEELARAVDRAERRVGRPLPPDPTPEDLQAFGLDARQAGARRGARFFEQNRQVTQYQKFYDESLAEQEPDVAAARQMFARAEALHKEDSKAELAVRLKAAAVWRRVLTSRHAEFYQSDRADTLNETTLQHEIEVGELLRDNNDPAVLARVAAAREVLGALVPANAVMTRGGSDPLTLPASEEEARIRIALAVAELDPANELTRRARQDVEAYYAGKPIPPAAYTNAARGLLDREFRWLVAGPQQANASFQWVRPQVRLEKMIKVGQIAPPPPPGPPAGEPAAP